MKICKIVDCKNKHLAKGYCQMHYTRNLRYGNPNIVHNIIVNAKGSGTVKKSGYKQFHKNGKTFLEHRLIMENYLGRKLLSNENVHHINGDRLDNRIENLELWTTFQPTGQRVLDIIKYIKNILNNNQILNNEEDFHYW